MATDRPVLRASADTTIQRDRTIDALDLSTTMGSGVGGVRGSTTLRRTRSAFDRTRVELQNLGPASGVRVEVERVPRQIYVYNKLNESTASYCDMTQDQQESISTAHGKMKALIAPNATTFKVNLSKMLVIYKEGGVEYMKDLQALIENDTEIRKAYGELANQVQPVWGAKFRNITLEPGRKTSATSPIPLGRHSEICRNLPTTYSKSAKMALDLYASSTIRGAPPTQADMDAALKRILAAEKIMHSQAKKLSDLKDELTTADPARKTILLAQIRELQKMSVDRFAVYIAVAFYPSHPNPSIAELTEAADKAKECLDSLVDNWARQANESTRKPWEKFKAMFRGGLPPLVEDNKTFCADAAALMFSTLPPAQARMGYLDFCRKHGLMPKTDCAEDSLMRFIGGVISTPPAANGVQVLDTAIGTIADGNLQAQCRAALNDFDIPLLKTLIDRIPDPNIKLSCKRALDKLDTDFSQPIERLSDPVIKQQCRTHLKAALSDAHAIIHGPTPVPATAVTLEEKIAHHNTVFHFE
ncbi:MAG: hypothetical protein JSS60_08265 [Verrucomicrobia bacterium]|nr:hypothetical protein [Verrucomicrobiota bacterium]